MRSLFVGRWQPLHDGHKALIQKVIDEGKRPLIAIRDTEKSDSNPYSVDERKKMIRDHFGDLVDIIVIPDISEMCYGRNVGYWVREIRLSPEVEAISGTKIRSERKS